MENQEQKKSYEQKIQAQLDEWRDDIDRLKEKAKPSSPQSLSLLANKHLPPHISNSPHDGQGSSTLMTFLSS